MDSMTIFLNILSVVLVGYNLLRKAQATEDFLLKKLMPKKAVAKIMYGQMAAKIAYLVAKLFRLMDLDGKVDDVEIASFTCVETVLTQAIKTLEQKHGH